MESYLTKSDFYLQIRLQIDGEVCVCVWGAGGVDENRNGILDGCTRHL